MWVLPPAAAQIGYRGGLSGDCAELWWLLSAAYPHTSVAGPFCVAVLPVADTTHNNTSSKLPAKNYHHCRHLRHIHHVYLYWAQFAQHNLVPLSLRSLPTNSESGDIDLHSPSMLIISSSQFSFVKHLHSLQTYLTLYQLATVLQLNYISNLPLLGLSLPHVFSELTVSP